MIHIAAPVCEVCGKGRGRDVSHTRCARKRQLKYAEENCRKQEQIREDYQETHYLKGKEAWLQR